MGEWLTGPAREFVDSGAEGVNPADYQRFDAEVREAEAADEATGRGWLSDEIVAMDDATNQILVSACELRDEFERLEREAATALDAGDLVSGFTAARDRVETLKNIRREIERDLDELARHEDAPGAWVDEVRAKYAVRKHQFSF